MKKSMVATMLVVGLSGCAGGIAAGTGSAVLVPVVASTLGVSTTTLSEIAAAGCATQASANLAKEIAARHGNPAWTAHFGEVSKVAGLACKW